jgi:hypothetical protein
MSYEQETPRETRDQERSGFHPVNVGHLVMGIAFVGLFVVWSLIDMDAVAVEENGWVLGLPWLVAGAVGLLATVLRRGHGSSGRMRGWIGSNDSPDSRA